MTNVFQLTCKLRYNTMRKLLLGLQCLGGEGKPFHGLKLTSSKDCSKVGMACLNNASCNSHGATNWSLAVRALAHLPHARCTQDTMTTGLCAHAY